MKKKKKARINIRLKFGQRVKQLRKVQKITQRKLAFKSKLSREEISRIERGEKNVALLTSIALSKGFGIILKELYNFKY
jgi:transcriptional regulator with XRE-family HTH domain